MQSVKDRPNVKETLFVSMVTVSALQMIPVGMVTNVSLVSTNKIYNDISGVMVSDLVWSVVKSGFQRKSGVTEEYKIGIWCTLSKQEEHYGVRVKSG